MKRDSPNPNLAFVYERMREQSGSVTLHFKDGRLQQVHYTVVEKIANPQR